MGTEHARAPRTHAPAGARRRGPAGPGPSGAPAHRAGQAQRGVVPAASNRAGQALLGGGVGPVMRACSGGCATTDDGVSRSAIAGSVGVQRSCDCGCGGACEQASVARSAERGGPSPTTGAPDGGGVGAVSSVVARGGRPLDRRTRRRMEGSFGRDFGGVRVHNDATAHRSARSLQAKAYTVGDHIVFGAGRYSPDSHEGTRLLAHELTHTVQQRDGRHVQRSGTVSQPGDAHEREADRVADAVAAGRMAPSIVRGTGPARISRNPLDDAVDWIGDKAEAAYDAAESAVDFAGDVVDAGVEAAGDAVDAATDGITAVYEMAEALARQLGGTFSVSGCGITIATPTIPIDTSVIVDVPVPEASLSVPFLVGVFPISGVVNAYGALYLNLSAIPRLQLQLGPVAILPARFSIDWCAPAFAASAGISYTVAAALGAEVRGGVGGEVGLEVNVPIGPLIVPIPIPLANIDAGLVGAANGTSVMNVTEGLALGYAGGRFAVAGSKWVDAGLLMSAGVGAFGALTVLGMNLCTLYWPFWQKSWEQTWSMGSGWNLGIGASGVDFTFGQVSMVPGLVRFDDFALDLDSGVLTDDCPPLEALCSILYALGLMPSQNGGTWSNFNPPPWGGPLEMYPRDPGFASQAKCRGACGPDCMTCTDVGDLYICEQAGDRHGWSVYPNAAHCPTHDACKEHDGCYDWCGSGGPSGLGPFACRRMCDLECACNNPVSSCVGWIFGVGGSGTMWFSDPPYSQPGCEGPCPTESEDDTGATTYRMCLPRVDLGGSLYESAQWSDSTGNEVLYSKLVPLEWLGFAVANIWARGDLSASIGAGIGPVYLDNVCLDVDPAVPTYRGMAELHVPAVLDAGLSLTGTLGANFDWLCLLELIRAEAGLRASAFGQLTTEFVDRVEVKCIDGEIGLVNSAWFDTNLLLGFDLDAFLRLYLLSFRVMNETWNLASYRWNREWRHEIELLSGTGAAAGTVLPLVTFGSLTAIELLRWLIPTHRQSDDGEAGGGLVNWIANICNPSDDDRTDDASARVCDPNAACGDPTMPRTEVRFWTSPDRGEHMRAQPLTKCPPTGGGGSRPDRNIFKDVWDQCIVPAGERYRWVRAHLLHGETGSNQTGNLHGSGRTPQNLILTDKSINGQMSTQVETPAIREAYDRHCILWYQVDVDHFDDTDHRRFFGEEVTMEWGYFNPANRATTVEDRRTITSNSGYQPPACPNYTPN